MKNNEISSCVETWYSASIVLLATRGRIYSTSQNGEGSLGLDSRAAIKSRLHVEGEIRVTL